MIAKGTLQLHGFTVTDAGKVRIPLQDDGSFALTEQQVFDMGIEVPTLFQLYSWKDMAEDCAKNADGTAGSINDQTVFIQGYTDSNFETSRCINVRTYNHLDSFRELPLDLPAVSGSPALWGNNDKVANNTADAYTLTRQDRSLIFVSKMYFDAVSRTAYADVDSGEAVEDKNDEMDDANKSEVDKVVGIKFEETADRPVIADDGTAQEFFRFNENLVHDGYSAIDGAAIDGYVTSDANPAPAQAYFKGADGTYVKATLTRDESGTLHFRTDEAGSVDTPAGDTVFYRYDAALIHDGYVSVPTADLVATQNGTGGAGGTQLYVKNGADYAKAVVEQDGEGVLTWWRADRKAPVGDAVQGCTLPPTPTRTPPSGSCATWTTSCRWSTPTATPPTRLWTGPATAPRAPCTRPSWTPTAARPPMSPWPTPPRP